MSWCWRSPTKRRSPAGRVPGDGGAARRPARPERRRARAADREAKPIYWLTRFDPLAGDRQPRDADGARLPDGGGRMASTSDSIRANVITLITPVQEVDGRDRMVDVYNSRRRSRLGPGAYLVYWGKYTAHDNNRDGMVLVAEDHAELHEGLSRVAPDGHARSPRVGAIPVHQHRHRSVQRRVRPDHVAEWHTLAYQEITELTRRGLPGVWTHGFYDGWAPNYIMAIAQSPQLRSAASTRRTRRTAPTARP